MRASSRLSWPQRLSVAAVFATFVPFFFWTATTSGYPTRLATSSGYYYAMQAQSFLAGQLNLLVNPRPELLALADPYDPAQNQKYRLHDAILYNRKYYLYYGPAPAILLFMPFRAITGYDLPEPLVVAFCCTTAVLAAFWLVRVLCRTYMPETPFWLLLTGIPALAFGSAYPFLLRRPIHYEVPIGMAHTCVLAATAFFVLGTRDERPRRAYLAIGSLLLGLGFASRFTMIFTSVIPVTLLAYYMFRHRRDPIREHVRTAVAAAVPVGICLFLLGLYNYQRFDSWTEFGLRYAVHGWVSARVYHFTDIHRVPWGLFYYMLAPPQLQGTFPFVRMVSFRYLLPPAPDYLLEGAFGGLLPNAPFIAILLFGPVFFLAFRRSHPVIVAFATASTLAGLMLLGLYSAWAGVMRYEIDFAIFLLIPALLLWYLGINALTKMRRTLLISAFVALVSITVIFNAAYSIVGCYDNLKLANPQKYEAIRSFFGPLERVFASL